jgi:hypothetical protein
MAPGRNKHEFARRTSSKRRIDAPKDKRLPGDPLEKLPEKSEMSACIGGGFLYF